MARASIWQDRFDRDAEHVVTRAMRVKGVALRVGQRFDKSLCSARTMRQLYEARKIRRVAASPDTATGAQMRHVGRGRFALFIDNARISDAMTRAEAEQQLAARGA